MNCIDQETLLRYLDGEMPIPDRKEVTLHLEACAKCRAEFEATEASRELVHKTIASLEPAEVTVPAFEYKDPKGLRRSLSSSRHPGLTTTILPRAWMRPAAILVAAALIVAVAIPMFSGDPITPPDPSSETFESELDHSNPNKAWHQRELVFTFRNSDTYAVEHAVITSTRDENQPSGETNSPDNRTL